MMLLLGKHQFIVSSIDECGICDPRSSSSSAGISLPMGSSKSRQSPSKRIPGSPFVSLIFHCYDVFVILRIALLLHNIYFIFILLFVLYILPF